MPALSTPAQLVWSVGMAPATNTLPRMFSNPCRALILMLTVGRTAGHGKHEALPCWWIQRPLLISVSNIRHEGLGINAPPPFAKQPGMQLGPGARRTPRVSVFIHRATWERTVSALRRKHNSRSLGGTGCSPLRLVQDALCWVVLHYPSPHTLLLVFELRGAGQDMP